MIPRKVVLVFFTVFTFSSSFALNSSIFGNVLIGDPCNGASECVGEVGSVLCSGTPVKKCVCVNGYIAKQDKTDCLRIQDELGGICEEGGQCTAGTPGQYSNCLPKADNPNELVCQCTDAGVGVGGGDNLCYKKALKPGDQCQKAEQCTANLVWSNCVFGIPRTCQCNAGATFNGAKCAKPGEKTLIGDRCSQDDQCVGVPGTNSHCPQSEKVCRCMEDFVSSSSRENCLPVVNDIGFSPCEEVQQCTSGTPGALSECVLQSGGSQKFCDCTSDAVHAVGGNVCHKKAEQIGDLCNISEQCDSVIEHSTCDDAGRCACSADYMPLPGNRECVFKKSLGDPCNENADCSTVDNAICQDFSNGTKSCQCSADYIQQPESNTKCNLAATKVGESCEEHESQCSRLEGAICFTDDFTCQCDTSTHVTSQDGGRCLKIADSLREECEETGQCIAGVEHSECKLSDGSSKLECLCSEHYVESESNPGLACMEIIDELEGKCDESIQCKAGLPGRYSECDGTPDKVCNCVDDAVHAQNGHTCYMKVDKINETCSISEQCANIDGGSLCSDEGQCKCLDNFVPAQGLDKCLSVASLNGTCQESAQCKTENSECDLSGGGGAEGVCLCKKDDFVESLESPDSCVEIVRNLNEACKENIQCSTGLGQEAECRENSGNLECQCKLEAIAEGGKCYKKVETIGGSCEIDRQCLEGIGEYAECVDATSECGCTSEAIPNSNKCLKIAEHIGDGCSIDEQCKAKLGELSQCNGTACICEASAVGNGDGTRCLNAGVLIGDSCETSDQCVGGPDSSCNNLVCECNSDFVNSTARDECLPLQPDLNKECREPQQCTVADSTCAKDDDDGGSLKCQCSSDFIAPPDTNKCNRLADEIGGSCEEFGNQCERVEGSTCVDDKCVCNDETQVPGADKKKCLDKINRLNETCEISTQCTVDHSSCLPSQLGDNQCLCDVNFVESEKKPGTACVEIVHELNKPCLEDIQCSAIGGDDDMTVCRDEKCACKPEAIPIQNECHKKATALGDPCLVDYQCEANLGGWSQCFEKTCICEAEAIPAEEKCTRVGIPIDDHCEATEECAGEPGKTSDCINSKCVCKSGYISSNTKNDCLIAYDDLGGVCQEPQQCTVVESTCSLNQDGNLTCQCSTDFIQPPDANNKCNKLAQKIGESCEESDNQCNGVVGSKCDSALKTCLCDDTTQVQSTDKKRCLDKRDSLHEPCEQTDQCQVGNSSCIIPSSPGSEQCLCSSGFIESVANQGKACLEIVDELDKPCEEPVQCSTLGGDDDMASCLGDICSCTGEAVEYQEKCYKKAMNIGEPCKFDIQCEVELGDWSQCSVDGTCGCEDGASDATGKCVRLGVHIGDTCKASEDCVGKPGETSECSSSTSTCVCLPGFIASTGKDDCLSKYTDLGGECKEDKQCTVPDSRCTDKGGNSTCQCSSDFIKPPDANNKCNKLAEKIGEGCVESDNQCDGVTGSTCDHQTKQCQCNVNEQIPSGDLKRCLDKRDSLNETCEIPEQCQVGNSSCMSSPPGIADLCLCNPGFIESLVNHGKACVEIADQLDDPCTEPVQCSTIGGEDDMTTCRDDKCACKSEAIPVENKCYMKDVAIGSPCLVPEQCVGKPGQSSECTDSKCACSTGFISSSSNDDCLVLHAELGGDCTEPQQCSVPESNCTNGGGGVSTCQCSPDFIKPPDANNKCNKLAEKIGETCSESDNQCTKVEGSTCDQVKKQCLCNDATQVPGTDNNKCLDKLDSLDQKCEIGTQCLVDNSDCLPSDGGGSEKSCLCKPDFVESERKPGKACVGIINKLNDTCDEDVQCQHGDPGLLSSCTPNGCQCTSEGVSEEDGNVCYKRANLVNDPCEKSVQCVGVVDSQCLNNTCQCHPLTGFPSSDKTKCLTRDGSLNTPCLADGSCNVNNSECRAPPPGSPGGSDKLCLCKQGEYAESDATPGSCVQIISEPNGQCDEPLQCTAGMGDFSECRHSRCQCQREYGFYQPDHTCYFAASLHGLCHGDEECHVGINSNLTSCEIYDETKEPRCRCLVEAIEINNNCYARKWVGDSCNSDVECSVSIGGQVRCDAGSKTCLCKMGYKPDLGNQLCAATGGGGMILASLILTIGTFVSLLF